VPEKRLPEYVSGRLDRRGPGGSHGRLGLHQAREVLLRLAIERVVHEPWPESVEVRKIAWRGRDVRIE
jgi:hypothetical protein